VCSKQVKKVFVMMQQTLQAHVQMNLKIRKKSSIKKTLDGKKIGKKNLLVGLAAISPHFACNRMTCCLWKKKRR